MSHSPEQKRRRRQSAGPSLLLPLTFGVMALGFLVSAEHPEWFDLEDDSRIVRALEADGRASSERVGNSTEAERKG